MPSVALAQTWLGEGARQLDELEALHQRATGRDRGRRWGTAHYNRMILLALAGQFQAYCRDLHDEAVDVHVGVGTPEQHDVVRRLLTTNRYVDRGNANRGNLGSDFDRLGFSFVSAVKASSAQAKGRLAKLDQLIDLRNAIAHGNDSQLAAVQKTHGIPSITLTFYRDRRRALNSLAADFDAVVSAQLATLLNIPPPW